MDGELQVDTAALHSCVPALLDLGAEMTAGSTLVPAPPAIPRWETSDAASALADAARAAMIDLAASASATGQAIAAALADYEAADERGAARIRAVAMTGADERGATRMRALR